MSRLLLKSPNGVPITVEVQGGGGDRLIWKVDDDRVEGTFQWLGGGGGLLRLGHRVMPCYFTRKNSRIEVWLGGETYSFDVLSAKGRSAAAAIGPVAEEILAPMPGTVLRIEVQTGDAFTAHQPLIIMESMKMEMTLSAPHAGRVAQIECTVGELVPMGKVLAKLEPMENDANVSV